MIHSSRRNRKIKAIAEVLAMIAAAEPEPCRRRPIHDMDEWPWEESATEFCAALDRYAECTIQSKKEKH
jgi:hypothetical protein